MAVLEDITKNLPSFQFESALRDNEKTLLHLRTRNLVVLSSACAQAAYFVALLNKGKKIVDDLKLSSNSSSYLSTKVGIIGCGRLGKQIATVLLELGHVDPNDLFISTRCPENLEQFANKEVLCCFDNKMVASKVDVLFLCCLPSQLHIVSKELRGNLNCVVYSFIGGMSLAKISQLLDYQQIIKPSFTFDMVHCEKSESTSWQFGRTITEALQDPGSFAETCPLSCGEGLFKFWALPHYERIVVSPKQPIGIIHPFMQVWGPSLLRVYCRLAQTTNMNNSSQSFNRRALAEDSKICEQFVFAFLNRCSTLGVGKCDAMRLCNLVMFGLEENQSCVLAINDVLPDEQNSNTCGNNRVFPVFDLVKLTMAETPLENRLTEENMKEAFIKKFKETFEK